MRLALTLVLAIIGTMSNTGASAQKATPDARTLSGEWTFSAEGYVMPLSLRQDGTKVTGTLEGFHGGFSLQGEFRKGLIHFAGSSDGGGIRHSDDSNEIDLCGNWDASARRVAEGDISEYSRQSDLA